MAPNINQVKGRIKTRNKEDPELDVAMASAKEAAAQEATNKANKLKRADSLGQHGHNMQVAAIYLIGGAVLLMFVAIVLNHIF